MSTSLQNKLKDIEKFFHDENKPLMKKRGKITPRRFFNLFRSDLQRLGPSGIEAYLNDVDSVLNDPDKLDGFGKALYNEYFNGKSDKDPEYLEALIYACFEMDAAYRFQEMKMEGLEKEKISNNLKIWRVL